MTPGLWVAAYLVAGVLYALLLPRGTYTKWKANRSRDERAGLAGALFAIIVALWPLLIALSVLFGIGLGLSDGGDT